MINFFTDKNADNMAKEQLDEHHKEQRGIKYVSQQLSYITTATLTDLRNFVYYSTYLLKTH